MVAILAVQGAFIEHAHALEKLGVEYKYLRNKADITPDIDRLILPGGESTTQRKLLKELEMLEPLKALIERGAPVLATCAGLILLAEKISSGEEAVFGTMPVEVCRNAYGRQLGSFSTVQNIGEVKDFPMRFIRAPFVEKVLSDEVEVLNVTDDRITAVKYKNQLGLAFHPELTEDLRLHKMFMDL